MNGELIHRRRILRYAGIAGTLVALSGCTEENDDDPDDNGIGEENGDSENDENGSEDDENVVIAGPDGDWAFEPEEIEVTVGETVAWYFDSPGHNATSHPDASDKNENPDDAEPFQSYEGDDHNAVNEEDTTFEHTFEVAGEYVYVCTPHENSMVGTVTVTE